MTTDTRKDAETLLSKDHRNVESLFKRCLAAHNPQERSELAVEVCKELILHTQIEEELFYPACRAHGIEDESVNEAQVAHDTAKVLIAELLGVDNDPFQQAKIQVLSDYIDHHVSEEEQPDDGLFAKARKSGIDLVELGEKIQHRKAEINAVLLESGVLTAPNPLSLHLLRDGFGTSSEFDDGHERERDESGRFVHGHGPIQHHPGHGTHHH
jgi:hypothetical protein